MVSGDDLFSEIIVFWNIILPLVEEDGFPFKIFSCTITEVSIKVCWSFSQKEHDHGGHILSVLAISHWSSMSIKLMNSQSGNKMMSSLLVSFSGTKPGHCKRVSERIILDPGR